MQRINKTKYNKSSPWKVLGADTKSRGGNSTFTLVIPQSSSQSGLHLIKYIRKIQACNPIFNSAQLPMHITVSKGRSRVPGEGGLLIWERKEQLLKFLFSYLQSLKAGAETFSQCHASEQGWEGSSKRKHFVRVHSGTNWDPKTSSTTLEATSHSKWIGWFWKV